MSWSTVQRCYMYTRVKRDYWPHGARSKKISRCVKGDASVYVWSLYFTWARFYHWSCYLSVAMWKTLCNKKHCCRSFCLVKELVEIVGFLPITISPEYLQRSFLWFWSISSHQGATIERRILCASSIIPDRSIHQSMPLMATMRSI